MFEIHPATRIGYLSLNVSDMHRSLEFYQSNETSSSHLLELVQIGQTKSNSGGHNRAGLYHFAIFLPERKNPADVLRYLSENRDQVLFEGLANHLVSESIYIRDPDFNVIEIYTDRSQSEWKWNDKNNKSRLQMATLPLNTKDLLKDSTDKGWTGIPSGTIIGHVNLSSA
jgi:catechol 2,3-dioxygenase